MENQLIVLPKEVEQLANNVSVEKRNEVQSVLNHVFNGVSKMREQLDGITVVDENDKVNMKLANTIRLGVRQVRLESEKTFDAKRTEVQQQMLSYKTEDSLWLKAKQTMQILTKEIEENARWKEETKDRFDAEQKELKIQQRILRVVKVAPEMSRTEFESMSDENFEIFLSGIEKAYNDRIEAEKKSEEERIAKEKEAQERKERYEKRNKELSLYWATMPNKYADIVYTDLSEENYQIMLSEAKKAKEKHDKDQEEQRIENERLKAEKEAARIKAEKAEKEAARISAEKAKLEADIKAKYEAEEKLRKEAEAKIIAEQKEKEAAEKKAKNAPDKIKLIELASQIDCLNMPDIKGEEAQKILTDVKTLLSKISNFIREKSNNL